MTDCLQDDARRWMRDRLRWLLNEVGEPDPEQIDSAAALYTALYGEGGRLEYGANEPLNQPSQPAVPTDGISAKEVALPEPEWEGPLYDDPLREPAEELLGALSQFRGRFPFPTRHDRELLEAAYRRLAEALKKLP